MNWVSEQDLAVMLGVSRARLTKVRSGLGLERGPDWRTGQNGRITLSGEAVARVTAALESSDVAEDETPPAEESPEGPCDASRDGGTADAMPDGVKSSPEGVEAAGAAENENPPVALPLVLDGVVVEVPRQKKVLVVKVAGETVRAMCRCNVNFIPGMTIRVRRPLEGTFQWFLEGRAPRWRGRW